MKITIEEGAGRVPTDPLTGDVIPRVLVVVHPDGYLEAYANRSVLVKFVMMPVVHKENEALAEEYIEASLPREYREVYWPANRRAVGTARRKQPTEIAWDLWRRELLRGIQGVSLASTEQKDSTGGGGDSRGP